MHHDCLHRRLFGLSFRLRSRHCLVLQNLGKHGIRGAPISVKPNSDELMKITKLIEEKKIKPIVSQVLPLTEAVKAQEQAATHHTRGKIVLKIAEEPK